MQGSQTSGDARSLYAAIEKNLPECNQDLTWVVGATTDWLKSPEAETKGKGSERVGASHRDNLMLRKGEQAETLP